MVALAGLTFTLAIFAQAALDLPYRLRWASPMANYWTVATLWVLTPVLVYLVARSLPSKWLRVSGFVVAAALILPCLMISSFALLEAPQSSEIDLTFILLSEKDAGRLAYRLYRTDCGATCAFGLQLREEIDLLFGLKLVTPTWSLDRASEGVIKLEQSSVLIMNGDDVLVKLAR